MIRTAHIIIVLIFLLIGCGTKSTVVLLPNPDGTIGEVEVASETGSQRLTQPNQATKVGDPKSTPSTPTILSEKEINKTFGKVIAIEPDPPQKYILYFKFGSSELTLQSQELLPAIIETLKNRNPSETELVISGHSDTVGDKNSNISLSLKRAKIVQDKLIAQGVKGFIVDITSHGEGNPIIKTADNVNEPQNRRVEVIIK